VPADDPTLLFTNAGMNQFKDVFLGTEKRSYLRAASSQKCVRAGGKHNDLENVGYTARHHTFFEMLGNFSFGDYFKHDAIRFAWDFLTGVLNIASEKLWVTVYASDDESYDIWANEIGVPAERIIRIGDKAATPYASDNFWQMGDTGPCGPCTEIFYDHGQQVSGGPPGSAEEDGDRFIEIWNVVFMQFNRSASGEMEPLPKPSVDTGMGLERVAAVMQQVHSNYEIDLFQNLLGSAAEILGGVSTQEASLRVIADHIRSCAFLIADGITPENLGRGSVLRRIIRRAVRHGSKLGATEPFFYKLVPALVAEMGAAFPELVRTRTQIEKILQQEEEQFARTLDRGLRLLDSEIATMTGDTIPARTVFVLHDTYGFPPDLTNDIARERGLKIDLAGYQQEMDQAREIASQGNAFRRDYGGGGALAVQSRFTGYDVLTGKCKITGVFDQGAAVDSLAAGAEGAVVLDATPFYAESGGQVGDQGVLSGENFVFRVTDTQKDNNAILHLGIVEQGLLTNGGFAEAHVDVERRAATALNHSATHLLHAALRQVLGEHVVQKGSLVDADKLRFDFAHYEALTAEQIRQVESLVNSQIRANTVVATEITSIEKAKKKGAMALFGEKYGESVRVLEMGIDHFSVELCGGTHVQRTGDIGGFVITGEAGISSGVRRIEAVTGANAEQWVSAGDAALRSIASLVKGSRESAADKVLGLLERNKQLEKELHQLRNRLATAAGGDLAAAAKSILGINVLAAQVNGVEKKALMETVDQLKNKLQKAAIVLATVDNDRIVLVAGVTKNETGLVKAGELVKHVAGQVGGKGGGRPDMAQGGGSDVAALKPALESVYQYIHEVLSSVQQ